MAAHELVLDRCHQDILDNFFPRISSRQIRVRLHQHHWFSIHKIIFRRNRLCENAIAICVQDEIGVRTDLIRAAFHCLMMQMPLSFIWCTIVGGQPQTDAKRYLGAESLRFVLRHEHHRFMEASGKFLDATQAMGEPRQVLQIADDQNGGFHVIVRPASYLCCDGPKLIL